MEIVINGKIGGILSMSGNTPKYSGVLDTSGEYYLQFVNGTFMYLNEISEGTYIITESFFENPLPITGTYNATFKFTQYERIGGTYIKTGDISSISDDTGNILNLLSGYEILGFGKYPFFIKINLTIEGLQTYRFSCDTRLSWH